MYKGFVRFPIIPWDIVLLVGLLFALVALLLGCAFRYDKASGGYTGAIACVDITGPGFSWKCNEGSKVPTLPDSQRPGQ